MKTKRKPFEKALLASTFVFGVIITALGLIVLGLTFNFINFASLEDHLNEFSPDALASMTTNIVLSVSWIVTGGLMIIGSYMFSKEGFTENEQKTEGVSVK